MKTHISHAQITFRDWRRVFAQRVPLTDSQCVICSVFAESHCTPQRPDRCMVYVHGRVPRDGRCILFIVDRKTFARSQTNDCRCICSFSSGRTDHRHTTRNGRVFSKVGEWNFATDGIPRHDLEKTSVSVMVRRKVRTRRYKTRQCPIQKCRGPGPISLAAAPFFNCVYHWHWYITSAFDV